MPPCLSTVLRIVAIPVIVSTTMGFALPPPTVALAAASSSGDSNPGLSNYPPATGSSFLPLLVRATKGDSIVRVAPSIDSAPFSGLYYDTYLPVLGKTTDSTGIVWYRVTLWGALDGWIRADQTEFGDPPPKVPVTSAPTPAEPTPVPLSSAGDPSPLVTIGQTRDQYILRSGPSASANPVGLVDPATPVQIRAWQADESGSVWYQVAFGDQDGWLWGGGVDLALSDPTATRVNGLPISSSVTGKGVWLPLPLLDLADPAAIVRAARALGVTHVYLEAGSSGGGFYGRPNADRFLTAAHQGGLKVVAWVLTRLDSVPTDVALSASIATYRTPSGDSFDGIAPDVEFNTYADDVRTFSEVLRTELGPSKLIVGVIYPAGSWTGRRHPVAGILSRSFNVLAPMAYWHESQQDFSTGDVYDFISQAVVDVQNAVGSSTFPVTVIAQGYDTFGRNGAGPSSPSGAETLGALAGARAGNAIGVSLFQWGTLTPDEWNVLRTYDWNVTPQF